MKIIKVGFYTCDNIKDNIISWWTYGPFVHSDITLGDSTYEASFDFGYVRKINYYDTYKPDFVIEIVVSDLEYKTILYFLDSIVGDKYDNIGILGFVLPVQDRFNKWFCSEVVSNCFKIIGRKKFIILEPSRISPNKLYSILSGIPINKYNRLLKIYYIFKPIRYMG